MHYFDLSTQIMDSGYVNQLRHYDGHIDINYPRLYIFATCQDVFYLAYRLHNYTTRKDISQALREEFNKKNCGILHKGIRGGVSNGSFSTKKQQHGLKNTGFGLIINLRHAYFFSPIFRCGDPSQLGSWSEWSLKLYEKNFTIFRSTRPQ